MRLLCGLVSILAWAADPVFEKALAQASQGNCPAAVATLKSAIKANPRMGLDFYRLLADCQLQLGQGDQAVEVLKKGAALYPSQPSLEKSLGQLLFRQRPENPEAGLRLGRAVQALPLDAEARHYFAQWAFLNGKEKLCVEQEQAALRLRGSPELALFQMQTLLGMCAERVDNLTIARQAFASADAINLRQPAYDPNSAIRFVQLLVRLGEEREADQVLAHLLEKAPGFGPGHLERARMHERASETDAAIASARRALEGQGNDINSERAAHGILARLYFASGNAEAAARGQLWIAAHPNPEAPQR